MINLLPDDIKRDMSAARSNVILFRYNLLTIAAAGGLLVICALFFVILNNNQSSAVSRSSENEAKAATYEPVQKAAEEYKANLATAKAILDKSVSYTTTIFEINRGSIIDTYELVSSGNLIPVDRNFPNNPHGLLITEYFENTIKKLSDESREK